MKVPVVMQAQGQQGMLTDTSATPGATAFQLVAGGDEGQSNYISHKIDQKA